MFDRSETFTGAIKIGQRVHCILYGGKDGTVIKIHGTQTPGTVGTMGGGAVVFGGSAHFDIIWDSGAMSLMTPESLVRSSVQWQVYDQVATSDDLIDAWERHRMHEAHSEATKIAEAARKDEERGGHAADNPDLVTAETSGLTGSKLAAKNIRTTLKRKFPACKFSIRTDYNSVRVSWTDGPSADQVKPFADRHSSGTFDGMTDCSGWDDDNTFGQMFGECRYVWIDRDITNETELLKLVAAQFCEHRGRKFESMEQSPWEDWNGCRLWEVARSIVGAYEIPAGHKITGIEPTAVQSGCASDFHLLYRTTTAPITADESATLSAAAVGPYWTAKGLYADHQGAWCARRYRKLHTAEKQRDKLCKLGHPCEVVTIRSRAGDYAIRRSDPAPTVTESISEIEIDAMEWI